MDDEEEDYFIMCNYWIVEADNGLRMLMRREDAIRSNAKLIMSYEEYKKDNEGKWIAWNGK